MGKGFLPICHSLVGQSYPIPSGRWGINMVTENKLIHWCYLSFCFAPTSKVKKRTHKWLRWRISQKVIEWVVLLRNWIDSIFHICKEGNQEKKKPILLSLKFRSSDLCDPKTIRTVYRNDNPLTTQQSSPHQSSTNTTSSRAIRIVSNGKAARKRRLSEPIKKNGLNTYLWQIWELEEWSII